MSSFLPPVVKIVANAAALDRGLFKRTIQVPALRVAASKVGQLRASAWKDVVLNVPRVKSVVKDGDNNKRLVLLKQECLSDEKLKLLDYSSECELVDYSICLDYTFWTADEVLSSILPEDVSVPGSFEMVGHLIHLNLLPEHSPYKHIIGQVMLDKHPQCRTVVNKLGSIADVYRVFDMEFLAGDHDTMVKVHEEGCTFTFDYAKVYWNSRLQAEHRRLVQSLQIGSTVCDMFAGVGPFAVPAAKSRKCIVYANDLNPESTKYLCQNAATNKVERQIKHFNMDGRDFVRQVFGKDNVHFDHVIMNLPASAHAFLDVFLELEIERPPTIHCYVFVRGGGPRGIALVEGVLKRPVESFTEHFVRNVAPNKDMHCISFRLPSSLPSGNVGPKRLKTEH